MPKVQRRKSKFICSVVLALMGLLCGCATSHPRASDCSRRFNFQRDTFAFPNELQWEYSYDANGNWTTRTREPKPSYSHHCFVLARSARQFFLNARFDPQKPTADERTYRKLIQKVVSTNPRKSLPEAKTIEIP